jgi:hypothetical protein
MGVYYKLVNVTKKEQFEPENIKQSGFWGNCFQIIDLLFTQWYGDEVRLVCDSEDGGLWDRAEFEKWPNKYSPDWAYNGPYNLEGILPRIAPDKKDY